MATYHAERMEMWPVSERVNSVSAEGADLLVKVEEPPKPMWAQPGLFDDEAA